MGILSFNQTVGVQNLTPDHINGHSKNFHLIPHLSRTEDVNSTVTLFTAPYTNSEKVDLVGGE